MEDSRIRDPFSSPDESGPAGHEWPASRLTADDMRRLRVLSNLTGLPVNQMLHVAVSLVFGETRDAMYELLSRHRETGKSLAQLLRDLSNAFSDASHESVSQTPQQKHPRSAEVTPPVPPSRSHSATSTEPTEEYVLVAETPPPTDES